MPIHHIEEAGRVYAIHVSGNHQPTRTEFVTPDDYRQQLGYIVYPAGGRVVPHRHRPLPRTIHGTSEVLLVKSGRCWVDFFRDDNTRLASRELLPGDLLVLVDGGHGFRMVEATVLIEIKQGPYLGMDDKERFTPVEDPATPGTAAPG